MSKKIEVEVPDEVHRKLLERCGKVGCHVSDYMEASVEYVLNGTSYFDFGEDGTALNEISDENQNQSLTNLLTP